ncbi:MAG: hypothetical protein L0Y44_10785 [Phycisphaerales bacterium]|nr:hypothetical protein [Phycisphaerales bacterium]MCI0631123.1 hypothetical protein [Phycisphaerales bacterium]MCI0674831.1 hypothetical protein [Phycisphaerales bacterium]
MIARVNVDQWTNCAVMDMTSSSCAYVRRPIIVILQLAIVMLLSGCISVTTKTALYDREKDRVFDEKLLGKWVGPDDKALMLTFERSERASYAVTIEEKAVNEGEPDIGLGDLVKIGSGRYLFLLDDEGLGNARRHSLPLKVKRRGDRLDLWLLNTQGLGQMLHDDPSLLPHEWVEPYREPGEYRREDYSRGKVAITASREQMQRFLREHDEELYQTSMQLKRQGKN